MKTRLVIALALTIGIVSTTSHGALFTEDFTTDPTANWTVNGSGTDIIADFFYDYSAIGVPAAPNGTGTRGLKMTANNSASLFGGLSVSPTGKSFTGDYRVSFDLWQNYVGPLGAGGSGSTQLSTFGIGTTGTSAAWPGSGGTATGANGVYFAATLDGGSSVDYRAYSSAATAGYPDASPVFQAGAHAGNRNNSDAYYTTPFPAQPAPAAQVLLYPGQTGSTDAGEIAFLWRRVDIDVVGGFATWYVDGLAIAKVDLSTVTLGGSNILFGHSDTNSSSSTDPNDTLLNITLIDNIVVIPEPATVTLAVLGGLGMVFFARRRM